jgi:transmembrane sensor
MEKLYSFLKIAAIITKEKTGDLSVSESNELYQWLHENGSNRAIYHKLSNDKALANELTELQKFDTGKAYRKVEKLIAADKKQVRSFKWIRNYLKYAAAVMFIAISGYYIFSGIHKPVEAEIRQTTIVPGKQKAILITSNNQQILLDSSSISQIITSETAKIVQNGSSLNYSKNDSVDYSEHDIAYNTLITPQGGEYTLVLSDGTEVMLNADSKLTYPVVFTGKSRQVVLQGEAFFKVAKSQETPFVVLANELIVNVYGTKFNVSAYNNENQIQTTLIEGSVGISVTNTPAATDKKIVPGQQFTYYKNNGITETKEVDTGQYIAWTKGMFIFENEPIENILKVLSRWYAFNYEFQDHILKNQRFTFNLDKYDDIMKILNMIAASSNLKFTSDENLITVSAK